MKRMQAGFTLIEMVLSMTILAILAALASSPLAAGFKARTELAGDLRARQDLALAHRRIVDEMRQAVYDGTSQSYSITPLSVSTASYPIGGVNYGGFTASGICFVRWGPTLADGSPGQTRVAFTLTAGTLSYVRAPADCTTLSGTGVTQAALLDNTYGLVLAFGAFDFDRTYGPCAGLATPAAACPNPYYLTPPALNTEFAKQLAYIDVTLTLLRGGQTRLSRSERVLLRGGYWGTKS